MTVRVLLIGFGLAGRMFHSRLVDAEPTLQITGIVTANVERRDQATTDFPGVRIFNRAEDAWDCAEDFDLAIVATANSAHVPQATAALEAGLHVVVDKPLAGSAAEAQALIELADRQGRQLHVFQNRRWDSEILTARHVIDEGLIGTPHRLESRFERWRPTPKGGWREDGLAADLPGLLYDLGAHLIDQALHLLGPIDRVVASVRAVRGGATADDDTQLLLWHTRGAISFLTVSAASAFGEPRLRLLGTDGGLRIETLDTQEDALRAGRSPRDDDWGMEADDAVLISGTDAARTIARVRGQWPTYYREVSQALRDGSPPPVDPRDVVANLRVIEAARDSALTNTVVTLDPPAGHVDMRST